MAVLTWYLTNLSPDTFSQLSGTDPGAEAFRTPTTGWVVSNVNLNHSKYYNDLERSATTFTDTNAPDGSLQAPEGDGWISPTRYSGSFASGDWNVHFAVRGQTSGGDADGRVRIRLFRGPNVDGSGAVEITSAQQQGGLVTNLATTATQVSTVTFNPGAFSVSNEFLFIQIGWERTGAGGATNRDVNVRVGNASGTGSRVITADFTGQAVGPAMSGWMALPVYRDAVELVAY